MSYREKIEKYKKNLLSEAERIQVEEDIEKVDVISEYLAEKLEEELDFASEKTDGNPETEADFGESASEKQPKASQKAKKAEEEFEKYVRRAIRRSFARMAVCIGAVLLAVIIFIQFGLSPVLDAVYYNPTEQIEIVNEENNSAIIYHKMSMDLDIYTALTRPLRTNNYVRAFPLGYGNYSIVISPSVVFESGDGGGVGGQIRRGKIELYDPNYFKTETNNVFACYGRIRGEDYDVQMREDTGGFTWRYSSLEEAEKDLQYLKEDEKYAAYVSFKRDLSFDEVNDLMKRIRYSMDGEPWLGVQVDSDNTFADGFIGHPYRDYTNIRTPKEYNDKYPELSCWDRTPAGRIDWDTMDEKSMDEAVATRHFVSMLDYMNDQKDFLDMMDPQAYTFGRFRGSARYVEENGLSYYGLACVTTKEGILEMMEQDEIIGIIPHDWN